MTGLRPVRHALAAALAAALALAAPGACQVDLRGYALGVGSHSGRSELVEPGTSWLGRGRAMLDWTASAVSLEAAYEHVIRWTPRGGGFGITNPGSTAGSTDWLPLDGALRETSRLTWRHRFDRLSVRVTRGPWEVIAGRQPISWATTLFLTPADPFAPFDPSDPFREYRGGVDAVRVRFASGPFTEIEAVLRLAEVAEAPGSDRTSTRTTALGRVATSRGLWAFGVWGGVLHDEPAAAFFTTGGVGATSLRGELAARRDDGTTTLRASVGVDRLFQPLGKDLYFVAEVQMDGYGAASPSELVAVALSEAWRRGDLQVLGRWTAAVQASWQLHPLVAVDALALTNLGDPSALLAPGLSWSTTASVSTRAGLFLGAGSGASGPLTLGSEYGSVPPIGYLSASVYF